MKIHSFAEASTYAEALADMSARKCMNLWTSFFKPLLLFQRKTKKPKTQHCFPKVAFMKMYDISVPFAEGLPTWPGDPSLLIEQVLQLEKGDGARVSRITFGDHSGTHLDTPAHMLESGTTLDDIPLSLLLGRVLVADLRGCAAIGVAELAGLPLAGEERLLFRTCNSALWSRPDFSPDFVALTAEGAEYLVSQGIRLVGIDYLSIESFSGDGAVHRTLLGHDVVILEGLDLSDVPAGVYELVCLPLRISGGAAAPARAVLRQF